MLGGYLTLRNLRSPGFAFGQNSETAASLSPDSWQHIHDRSICQILLPDTYEKYYRYICIRLLYLFSPHIYLQIAGATANASETWYWLGNTARVLKHMNNGRYLTLITTPGRQFHITWKINDHVTLQLIRLMCYIFSMQCQPLFESAKTCRWLLSIHANAVAIKNVLHMIWLVYFLYFYVWKYWICHCFQHFQHGNYIQCRRLSKKWTLTEPNRTEEWELRIWQ